MFSEKDIEAVRNGTWEFAAVSMNLKRCDGRFEFNGTGTINQDAEGRLQFMLIAPQFTNRLDYIRSRLTGDDVKISELCPRGQYYELYAEGKNGTICRSSPTLDVDANISIREAAVVKA